MQIGALDQVLTGRHGVWRWDEDYCIAQELGFDGVELGVGADYQQTQLWDPAGRQELRQLAHQHDVATASICLHSYWRLSFADADVAIQAQAAQLAREACAIAAELGAGHLLVPLTCPEGVPVEVARERWIAGLRACAPAAEDSGACLCIENVGRAFANEHEDIVAIVDAVGSPAVQVYYDPGNAVHYGTAPLEGVAVLGRRIAQVHVKEMGGTLLGEGNVPWPQLLAALAGVGYDGWLVLETEATDDPVAAARYNLDVLRGWLAGR